MRVLEEVWMKKVLAFAATAVSAAGALWALQRSRADQAEAELWAEATDSVGAPDPARGP
ncbi:hypothetical protein BH20ACT6_BH20ACT6_22640 [soil metagenome]